MDNEDHNSAYEGKWYQYPPMRNALIAGAIAITTLVLTSVGWISDTTEIIAYIFAIVLGGYHWTAEGIEELVKEKQVGIEMLMIAATIGSAVLVLWEEAAFLVVIFAVAEGLEGFAFARTRASIRKLLDLAPKEARLLVGGKEQIVLATSLKVGDVFLVKPGESIATDGTIIEGQASINEANVTGESIPVDKKETMNVFATTTSLNGILKIKATKTFEDNTLSKMIHMVEEAQDQKGATQTIVEKFGNIFSPIVLFSAFLFLILPPVIGIPSDVWATRAVVLLVAAAPCALVMATPVSITAAISKAGLQGVLIKGGVHLENLGKIRVVAVDKTGTLTKGQPVVTDVISLKGDEQRIIDLAYSVDKFSNHPLALAIVKKAEHVGAALLDSTEFKEIAGYGAQAKIGAETAFVGKPGLFKNDKVDAEVQTKIDTLRTEGKSVILVGTDQGIEGLIGIADEIRPEAKLFIEEMHRMNIAVVMLTGDNATTAKAFAEQLGIDDFRADLKPEEKVSAIKELIKKHGPAAMVGDGINDSPALAHATIGMAMGVAGADAAIEAADVALMADDLQKVAFAFKLGKESRKITLQNVVFSILILAVLIPSAVIGFLSVGVAVITHEASELLAVANGLRVGSKSTI